MVSFSHFIDIYIQKKDRGSLPFLETSISRDYFFSNYNNLLRRNKMVIYKATNQINNKSYIGQTIYSLELRKRQHITNNQSNSYFHKALNKYGEENFKWEVLYECNSIEELNNMEQHYIDKYNTFIDYGYGYNLTTGGENYVRSNSTKDKMKDIKTGNKHTDETKDKIRLSLLGRNRPKEVIEKIRKSHLGKKFSTERKMNISKALIGKKTSNEHRKNISKAITGENHWAYKKKLKSVICLYCDKRGAGNIMKRWHFDNCKYRTEK